MSEVTFLHPDAPPDKAWKYTRRERERRFLLRELPKGEPARVSLIRDRYVTGTRLRLRHVVEIVEERRTDRRRLTQKIPQDDGTPGLVTTIYLSAREHEALAMLPARGLAKTRFSMPPFGVDVFEGELQGLILAEIEFDDDDSELSFVAPPFAVAEVTRDVRFTGGRWIATTRAQLAALLAEHGVFIEI
jgi:CYTH domain-containing protein